VEGGYLTPDQARSIAAAAGFAVAEEELESFTRGLARVRGFAAQLHALDLEGVPPWTPTR
jgi:Asp-tRNA(Asn)/Glu-tRNA(Gln) amidotransferase C subunit